MTILHQPDSGILFAADLVGNHVTPWLVDGHSGAWLEELKTALPLYVDVATCLPGHGAAAPAAMLIDAQVEYLTTFRDLVQVALTDGPLTDTARASIRAATEARYPGYSHVAPSPDLIEMNADAVATELSR